MEGAMTIGGVVDDDRETLVGDTLVKVRRLGKSKQYVTMNRDPEAVRTFTATRRESRVVVRRKSARRP